MADPIVFEALRASIALSAALVELVDPPAAGDSRATALPQLRRTLAAIAAVADSLEAEGSA
jgi:hypothetical protein